MFTLENLWNYETKDKHIENTVRYESYNKGMKKYIKDGISKGKVQKMLL